MTNKQRSKDVDTCFSKMQNITHFNFCIFTSMFEGQGVVIPKASACKKTKLLELKVLFVKMLLCQYQVPF